MIIVSQDKKEIVNFDNIMNININIPVSSQILLGIGTICLAILIAILFFFIIKLIIFLIKQLINCFK